MRIHNGKPHKCLQCQRAFLTRPELERHIRTHTGEKPFSCTKCPYKFYTKSELTKHTRKHTKEATSCSTHDGVNDVVVEYTQAHASEKSRHQCSVCKKLFPTKEILTRHGPTHLAGTHPKRRIEGCGLILSKS